MAGSYHLVPASRQHRYAPHAYGGSPADALVQTLHENSLSRRRPGESHDIRKSFLQPDRPSSVAVFNPAPYDSFVASIDSPGRSFDSAAAHNIHEIVYGRDSVPQTPKYPPGRHRQTQLRRQRLAYAGRPPANYRFSSTPAAVVTSTASSSKTTRQERHAPVVFGNLHESASVMTGVSQQELLRKKARDDSRKKRHRKAKKKVTRPIVNIPLTLTQALTPKKSYYDNINSIAGSDMNNIENSFGSFTDDLAKKWSKPSTIDDNEQSTAESTRTDERPPDYVVHKANSFGAPSLYSDLPQHQAVLNEADGDSILLWTALDDAQSMESFPFLSNHGGISLSGHENISYTPRLNQEDDIMTPMHVSTHRFSDSNAFSEDSSRSQRAVRFSHQNSYSSVPWDEREDEELAHNSEKDTTASRRTSPASDTAAVVTPLAGVKPPKSILRSARFSDTNAGARTSTAYFAQLQAFREKHYRRTEAVVDRDMKVPIYKSPPRHETGFADPNGDVLSPIPTSPSFTASRTSAVKPGILKPPTLDRESARAFREILEQANHLYHSNLPNFPEDEVTFLPLNAQSDDQSQSSEPGPELFKEEMSDVGAEEDDKASLVDAANFIETIAAVVIQTAFRRYRVQWIYASMLARRRSLRHRQEMATTSLSPIPSDSGNVASQGVSFETVTERKRTHVSAVPGSIQNRLTASIQRSRGILIDQSAAATRIQAFFRGYWARDCISVDTYCATLIQKTWRSHLARHSFLCDLYSIVLVQGLWRRHMARITVGVQLYAIVLIQKMARGFLAKRKYRALKRLHGSKVMANRFKQQYAKSQQTSSRLDFASLAQKKRKHDDLRRKNVAAVIIQKSWRRFRDERMYIKSLVDILTVQTLVRSWIAERREKRFTHTNVARSALSSWTASKGNSDDADAEHEHPDTKSVFTLWQERSRQSGRAATSNV